MGEGEIGTEADRSFVARERLDIAALLMTHVAKFIMRVGECGELFKRELELCGGFVEPTRSSERFGDAPGVGERAGEFAVRARAVGPLCNVVLPNRNGRVVIDVAPRGDR